MVINMTNLVRIKDIVNNPKTGKGGLLPICRSSFLNGVKSGLFPKPIKLGVRSVAWNYSEIMRAVSELERVP